MRRGGIIGAGPRRAASPGKVLKTWRGQLRWYTTAALPYPVPATGRVVYDTTTGKRAVSDGTYWREDGTAVAPVPVIDDVEPSSAPIGATVRLSVSRAVGALIITIGGVACGEVEVDSPDTWIDVVVPEGALDGPVRIENAAGADEADLTLLLPPTIASYSASSGVPGTVIDVYGVSLTGADTATVCGIDASGSLVVLDDEHAQVTVPSGAAAAGAIVLESPAGTATGPSFALKNFILDLTRASPPPGCQFVLSAASDFRVQTGDPDQPLERRQGATPDVAENLTGEADGWRRWTFPAHTNDSPLSLAGAGWSMQGGMTREDDAAGTAPDGAAAAQILIDATTGATGYAQYLGTVRGSSILYSSIWARDDPSDPPDVDPGAALHTYIGHLGLVAIRADELPNGSAWRRLIVGWPSPGQYAMSLFFGAERDAEADGLIFHVAATGRIKVFAPAAVEDLVAVTPYVAGAAGSLHAVLDAETLSTMLTGPNALHHALTWETDEFVAENSGGTAGSEWTLLAYQHASGGDTVLQWRDGGVTLSLAGAAENSMATGFVAPRTLVSVEFDNDPGAGQRRIRLAVNGCHVNISASVNLTVPAITAAFLGTLPNGTKRAPMKWARWEKVSADIYRATGLDVGDSVKSAYSGDAPPVPYFVYEGTEALTKGGIATQAFPGDTIGTGYLAGGVGGPLGSQYAKWLASPHRGNPDLEIIWVMIAINDISEGANQVPPRTITSIIGDYQTWLDDVATQNPNVRVIAYPLVPTAATLNPTQQGWVDLLNEAIAGAGPTPLTFAPAGTGVLVRAPKWTGARRLGENDTGNGDDPLAAEYDTGDGRHVNRAARMLIGAAMRADALSSGGLP